MSAASFGPFSRSNVNPLKTASLPLPGQQAASAGASHFSGHDFPHQPGQQHSHPSAFPAHPSQHQQPLQTSKGHLPTSSTGSPPMSSSHHTSMSAAAGIAAAVPAQSGSAFVLPAPLQAVSTKFNRFLQSTEEIVDQVSRPIGKYLPYVARFLIVLTFLEDAIRLFMNWDEQMSYLISRRGFNGYFAMFFLTSNIMLQTLGSFIVIGFGKLAPVGVGSLFYGLVLQTFGYAIYSDLSMLIRTLSLCGGLCLLASEALDTRRGRNAKDTSRRNLYAGLPELDAFEPAAYLQVAGRLFYMSLIVALLFDIEMDLLGVLYAMFVTVMCGAVMVGFHARANAVLLVVILVVHNFTVNDYWSVSYYHVLRDTMMYSFYQTWSVIGGLLLLANLGAGEFSIDKMKKSR